LKSNRMDKKYNFDYKRFPTATIMMRKVRVCFYEPKARNEPWLNVFAAMVGKISTGFYVSHVEVQFEDDRSCSIFGGEAVFFRRRSYSNPNYIVKSIMVEDKQYEGMYNYCVEMEGQVKFSDLKMFCGPYFGLFCNKDATFCSELVCRILQRGKVESVKGMNPSRCTPASLLRHMNNSQC
jgi:hypothetical protein